MRVLLRTIPLLILLLLYQPVAAQISAAFYKALPVQLRPENANALSFREITVLLENVYKYPISYKSEVEKLIPPVKLQVEKTHNVTEKIGALLSLANYYDQTYQSDSAYTYSKKVLSLADEFPIYAKHKAAALFYIGDKFYLTNNYDSSIGYTIKAITISEQLKDTSMLKQAYERLSENYSRMHQLNKAVRYIDICKSLSRHVWDDDYAYYHIYKIKFFVREYEEHQDESWADSVITLSDQLFKNTRERARYWYGSTYLMLGRIFNARQAYKKALPYFDSSLTQNYHTDDRFFGLSDVKERNRQLCLIGLGNKKLGEKLLDSLGTKDMDWKRRISRILYLNAVRDRNWQDALTYFKKFTLCTDSMKLNTANDLLNETLRNYTLKEKETKIKTLEIKNLMREKQQTRIISFAVIIALVMLLAISFLVGIARYLQIKRASEKQQLVTELYKMEEAVEHEREQQKVRIAEQRRKIAEDMHDEVSSGLAAFRFYIADIRERMSNTEAKEALCELEAEASVLYKQARDFMKNLNSSKSQEEYDVTTLVDQLSSRFCREKVLVISGELDRWGIQEFFTSEMHHALYLLIKEAVANSIKYSGANRLRISIGFTEYQCNFEISDNGKGFNVHAAIGSGIGLKSMQHRIEALAGTLTIESGKTGTLVKGSFKV